ncbi:hypothetical protein PT974_11932 [Cladobotryum mycophilum]|uniref:Uncharacterized protein n=1 Tax=Cladobotryum mycophilum TaxID=491253 RepID=A0ABR0S6L2_9HYPO
MTTTKTLHSLPLVSTDTDDSPTQDKPRWLMYLEEEILADEDTFDDASSPGVLKDSYIPNLYNCTKLYDKTAVGFLNLFTHFCYELAGQVQFPSLEHERLALLLIRIKELGPQAFEVENPDFESYDEALLMTAEDCWNAYQVPSSPTMPRLREKCNASLGVAAFSSKLFAVGILRERGAEFASVQIGDGLKLRKQAKSPKSELGQFCMAEIAAQGILISGTALAAYLREPKSAYLPGKTEWGLKKDAGMTYARMAELFPEWFVEEEREGDGPQAMIDVEERGK